MITPVSIDLATLTAPLKPKQPSGKDLRHIAASLYHKLKDARAAVRAVERKALQDGEATVKANWQVVSQLAQQILATQSKDLEVTAWLIEALLREHGFAGLSVGFRLARELIARYWEILYPLPDEEGLQTKIAPLTGLNGEETDGTLIIPLAMTPLTEGAGFALWQYQQAVKTSNLELIKKAADETSPLFFQTLMADLQAALDEYAQLNNLLTEKCGNAAPPSSRIRAQLMACLECINNISVGAPLVGAQGGANTNARVPTRGTPTQINDNVLNDRENALQTLLQIAEFFRRTEPHSPLPYILERTVRWGRLGLPELLRELVKDEQAWSHLCHLTGIQTTT